MGRVRKLNLLLADAIQNVEENRNARLVIEEAALHKALLGNQGARIEGDKVTHFDAERSGLFLVGHLLVEAHFHVVLRSLCRARILVDVAAGLVNQDGSADFLAASRVHRAVLALDHVPGVAADLREL